MIDPGGAPGQTLSCLRSAVLLCKTPTAAKPHDTLELEVYRTIKPNLGEDRSMRSAVSFIHPRDEILQAIQRIYRYRMTTTSGGNLSIREENGDIWITPARLDKGSLRREDSHRFGETSAGRAVFLIVQLKPALCLLRLFLVSC